MRTTLDGRAVIVTGAGRGLGHAYARALGSAGAAVMVNDVDLALAQATADQITAEGGRAHAHSGSVAEWESARDLVQACQSAFGAVDALVNNAGIARHAPAWEESEENMRAVIEVNLLGPMFMGHHAMKAMIDHGRGGSIINIISGSRFGIPGMSTYGASKGGVAALTLNWAIDARPHGIRVNALSPLGQTDMARADTRADAPELPDPRVIAPIIVALLDDRARDLTGALLRFDGDHLSVYGDSLGDTETPAKGWTIDTLTAALATLDAAR